MNSKIELSTDKNELDIEFINSFISDSFWAKGRTFVIGKYANFGQ